MEKVDTNPLAEFHPVFLSAPRENIVLLQAILESYDNLGILRTLDKRNGQLVILAIRDSSNDLKCLLESLEEELKLKYIDPPENWEGDWLLKEFPPSTV